VQSNYRGLAWAFVDRVTVGNLLFAFTCLTLIPALGYLALSNLYPDHHGLVNSDKGPIGVWDAIYFSIITETTLGYGDIRPIGWSRLISSVQVLLGLLLGGISVAKLTSSEGRELRQIANMTGGDWIEPFRMPNGTLLISLSRFYLGVDGLKYDGENFDSSGAPLGFFEGNLIAADGSVLKFRYSTRNSSTAFFTEGNTSHRFIAGENGELWVRHHATARDFGSKVDINYEGFRASVQECQIIHGNDLNARRLLVQRIASEYGARVKANVDGR
jgi:Ion channel